MNTNITPQLRRVFRWHLQKIHGDLAWPGQLYGYAHAFFKFEPSALNGPATYAAWNMAKLDIAGGEARWQEAPSPSVGGTCHDAERWVENYAQLGIRLAGNGDDLDRSIEHTGWFTRNDGDFGEKVRGAVFLLTGRKGVARAVPGYIEDGFGENHSAYIDFGNVFLMESVDKDDVDYRDVARAANAMAESAAEKMRDYDTAWQAGQEWARQRDDMAELRTEARAIVSAARKERPTNPTICAALRSQVEDLREQVSEIWSTMRELAAGAANGYCFYPSDELAGAFNEGASFDVI